MKNRPWYCRALDIAGLIALLGAGVALAAALWLSGSTVETALLVAFKYSLTAAVGSFLIARVWEIVRVLQVAPDALPHETVQPANNVETLKVRESLPPAA